jgi:hypothetical protein
MPEYRSVNGVSLVSAKYTKLACTGYMYCILNGEKCGLLLYDKKGKTKLYQYEMNKLRGLK